MSQVTVIEIEVGLLPEWYDEGEHDFCLEQAIEDEWHKNPDYTDASVNVSYNYQTDEATVKAYDDDGSLVFERDNHNLDYAFEYARQNC